MRFIDRFPMVSKKMGLQVDIAQSSLPEDVFRMKVQTPDFAQDKAIPVLPYLQNYQPFELGNGKFVTRANNLVRLGGLAIRQFIPGPVVRFSAPGVGGLQVRTNDLIRIKD